MLARRLSPDVRVGREGMKRPASNEGRRKDDDVGRALFSGAEGTFDGHHPRVRFRTTEGKYFEFLKTQERNNQSSNVGLRCPLTSAEPGEIEESGLVDASRRDLGASSVERFHPSPA